MFAALMPVQAQDTSARFEVDERALKVGERLEGTMVVEWDAEEYESVDVEQPEKLGDFDIVDWSVGRETKNESGRRELRVTFSAAAFELGEQLLGPYKVGLRLRHESGTPALPSAGEMLTVDAKTFEVKSMLEELEAASGETVELASPIKGPLELEREYGWLWWMVGGIAGGLVLLAALVLLIKRLMRRTRSDQRPEMTAPLLSPDKEAMAALRELEENEAFKTMPAPVFYEQVSYILRRYLERRHRFEALEMTSSEILEVVAEIGWPGDLYDYLRSELAEWDAAKFAKYEPPMSRRRTSIAGVREVVERTRPAAVLPSHQPVATGGGDA